MLQVLPAAYDFGKVTPGNEPAALEVSVSNTGTGNLSVSGIAIGADPNFALVRTGGSKPCGAGPYSIAAGDRCTVQVTFKPQASGTFASTVQVTSNGNSTVVPISGQAESVARLTVRINQLQTACPTGSNEVTAYVSVTDQGGYPVTGLLAANFSVTQETVDRPLLSPPQFVAQITSPVAVAGALDFSGSLTGQPVAFADMKTGFANFFDGMSAADRGEVLKFASEVEVTQPFTSDKASLKAAISAPFDKGTGTRLYDATIRATNDTALNPATFRRAVIVATDGLDTSSTATLTEAINNAALRNVPVFAIGIGGSPSEPINDVILEQMAASTGGLYYKASVSQNLATIYKQLASVLYTNQYVIRFNQLSKGAAGTASSVRVGASLAGVTGTGDAPIASCN